MFWDIKKIFFLIIKSYLDNTKLTTSAVDSRETRIQEKHIHNLFSHTAGLSFHLRAWQLVQV